MAMYISEVTLFLNQLKAERPYLEEEQRKGRAIWWDKAALDLQEFEQQRSARVPQQAYPYSTR
jgi:hypothetical protein